jgi:type I restriction enzyme M protein
MDRESLSSIIKRARDIMRKDAGLSTDVDRIPQLSWILFLKTFDDLERERYLLNPNYREAIEKPYRWRDWAAEEEKGLTGDELINFVNNKLFPYLRGLVGTDEKDQRTVIAEVFREIYNSMRSGYLLRDIISLVNKIDFTSSDDIHTMAHLYESMLKEMRDAAGSNGEFYTPRPVIRFIVNQIKPQIGEKILDPALGTGGFLTESYEFMKSQQKKAEDREILQYHTFFGIEKKPMPYLLGMMNLLLHEIEKPNIKRDNALRLPLYEITEKDRVNVIMTNPPFGGEEERGIMSNFPEATRTSETALLFLQFVMRKLKDSGRCGMVVPNGVLFAAGVGERIKKELLENFNLHTIVRLPKGVFAPYTDIETNLLFFGKEGPTKEIWYYEQPFPIERQKMKNPRYNKTQPLRYEEFEPLQKWWNNRAENENAWKVPIEKVKENAFNLDIKNPNKAQAKKYRTPVEVAISLISKEKRIFELIHEIQEQIRKGWENEE